MNIIKQKERGLLIVISGPSGAGKDTIVNEVIKNKDMNLFVSISATTRLPRGSEENGKDYFFLTKDEFIKRINNNDFLEYAIYNDNYYGTPKYKIEEYLAKGIDVILIIEIQGALKIKSLISDALFIFIMPPSMDELKNRLVNRNTDSKEKIFARFKQSYKEINEVKKYNYVVVNDDISKASNKVISIINAEKCRVDRIEDVFLNNQEELLHELLVDMQSEEKDC